MTPNMCAKANHPPAGPTQDENCGSPLSGNARSNPTCMKYLDDQTEKSSRLRSDCECLRLELCRKSLATALSYAVLAGSRSAKQEPPCRQSDSEILLAVSRLALIPAIIVFDYFNPLVVLIVYEHMLPPDPINWYFNLYGMFTSCVLEHVY
jgi:hypothetical protein